MGIIARYRLTLAPTPRAARYAYLKMRSGLGLRPSGPLWSAREEADGRQYEPAMLAAALLAS